jgi:hypothetical protein
MANLKDPDSAKFIGFTKPKKDHVIANQSKMEVDYGYSVCATVNAKNSYGGYSGPETEWILISKRKVVRVSEPGSLLYLGGPFATCSN